MSKYLLVAAVAVTLSALGSAAPASAAEYPWCAQYGGSAGGRNCGFTSFPQCMATVSGMGGYCERNQFYEPNSRRR
jgi:hypothetical protein